MLSNSNTFSKIHVKKLNAQDIDAQNIQGQSMQVQTMNANKIFLNGVELGGPLGNLTQGILPSRIFLQSSALDDAKIPLEEKRSILSTPNGITMDTLELKTASAASASIETLTTQTATAQTLNQFTIPEHKESAHAQELIVTGRALEENENSTVRQILAAQLYHPSILYPLQYIPGALQALKTKHIEESLTSGSLIISSQIGLDTSFLSSASQQVLNLIPSGILSGLTDGSIRVDCNAHLNTTSTNSLVVRDLSTLVSSPLTSRILARDVANRVIPNIHFLPPACMLSVDAAGYLIPVSTVFNDWEQFRTWKLARDTFETSQNGTNNKHVKQMSASTTPIPDGTQVTLTLTKEDLETLSATFAILTTKGDKGERGEKGDKGDKGDRGDSWSIFELPFITSTAAAAGGTAGAVAGETAGAAAGSVAGSTAGASAGSSAGATAGTIAAQAELALYSAGDKAFDALKVKDALSFSSAQGTWALLPPASAASGTGVIIAMQRAGVQAGAAESTTVSSGFRLGSTQGQQRAYLESDQPIEHRAAQHSFKVNNIEKLRIDTESVYAGAHDLIAVADSTKPLRNLWSQGNQGIKVSWNDIITGDMHIKCNRGLGRGAFAFETWNPDDIKETVSWLYPSALASDNIALHSWVNSNFLKNVDLIGYLTEAQAGEMFLTEAEANVLYYNKSAVYDKVWIDAALQTRDLQISAQATSISNLSSSQSTLTARVTTCEQENKDQNTALSSLSAQVNTSIANLDTWTYPIRGSLSYGNQGWHVSWNREGYGATYFTNGRGLGSGGWAFRNVDAFQNQETIVRLEPPGIAEDWVATRSWTNSNFLKQVDTIGFLTLPQTDELYYRKQAVYDKIWIDSALATRDISMSQLEGRVTTNTSNITAAQNAIAAQATSISNLSTAQSAALSSLSAQVATKTTLGDVGTYLTQNYTTTVDLQSLYLTKSLAASIYATQSSLSSLQNTVTQHGSGITLLQSSVAALESTSSNLSSRVNALESGTGGYVTLGTVQNITGAKSFSGGLVSFNSTLKDIFTFEKGNSKIKIDTDNSNVMLQTSHKFQNPVNIVMIPTGSVGINYTTPRSQLSVKGGLTLESLNGYDSTNKIDFVHNWDEHWDQLRLHTALTPAGGGTFCISRLNSQQSNLVDMLTINPQQLTISSNTIVQSGVQAVLCVNPAKPKNHFELASGDGFCYIDLHAGEVSSSDFDVRMLAAGRNLTFYANLVRVEAPLESQSLSTGAINASALSVSSANQSQIELKNISGVNTGTSSSIDFTLSGGVHARLYGGYLAAGEGFFNIDVRKQGAISSSWNVAAMRIQSSNVTFDVPLLSNYSIQGLNLVSQGKIFSNGWRRDGALVFAGNNSDMQWSISSDADFMLSFIRDGAQRAYISAWGDFVKTSDRRRKTDIERLQPLKSLDELLRLQPCSYKWTDQGAVPGKSVGLIAQDCEQVNPHCVVTDSEGNKSLCYNDLLLHAINAIQALSAQNDALRQRVETLEKSLASK